MKDYKINEIFRSIQGEGQMSGTLVTFVRFSECNLTCSYCDTDFDHFDLMSLEDIYAVVKDGNDSKILLITGGEPLLQLDNDFLVYFQSTGFKIFLETSGSVKANYRHGLIDYTTVSPKVGHLKLGYRPDELRVPVTAGSPVDKFMKMEADAYYLSPVFDGDIPILENVEYCLRLLREYPWARLSLQIHKWIGVK